MTIFAHRIFDGIATREECFALISRSMAKIQTYEGPWIENPHHGLGYEVGQFFEIRREEYDYFLNVLPPMAMNSAGFVMSEFTAGNHTEAFLEIDRKLYCMTIAVNMDGADAELHRAGSAIQAVQSGRVLPTEALLAWAAYLTVCDATPPSDMDVMTTAAEAALLWMDPPDEKTVCGLFKPGAIAFYQDGKPWRFSHKGNRKLPAAVWYFPPKGVERERRDALKVAMAATAEAEAFAQSREYAAAQGAA